MEMRHIDSIVVKRAIVHVLDKNSDEPLYNSIEMELSEEINEYFTKHILKGIKSANNYKARFISETNIKNTIKGVLNYDIDFIEGSKQITERIFRIMKNDEEIHSFDFSIVEFASGASKFLALLKMDFQKTFSHEIEFDEDRFKINIIAQDISLPGFNQRISECAFIKESDYDDSYDMLVVEKVKGSLTEHEGFFTKNFLNAQFVFDTREQTKQLKKYVEDWTRKNLKEDIYKAESLRNEVNDKLKNHAVFDLEEISNRVLSDDAGAKLSFDTNLEREGFDLEEKMEVDKLWVKDKMKKRTISTDTGFIIKSEYENFDDSIVFEMRPNGDGTVDYIIKNVKHVKER